MKKSLILVIIPILLFITGCENNNNYTKNSKYYYNTISLLKENKYSDAYNQSKKIKDAKERKIIETIFIYKFKQKVDELLDAQTEYVEKCSDVISSSYYSSIFGDFTVSASDQDAINKINDEKIKPFETVKKDITASMLPTSATNYYNNAVNYYDKLLNSCSDIQNKLSNNEENPFTSLSSLLGSLVDEYKKISDKYPLKNIPEEYRILLDL